MTDEKTKQVGQLIGVLINLVVNVCIGYLLGHQFHSFAIGFTAYAVLSTLDSINLRLVRLSEGK